MEAILRLGQDEQVSSQFRTSRCPRGSRNYFDSFWLMTFSEPRYLRNWGMRWKLLPVLCDLNIIESLREFPRETSSFVEQLQFLGNFSLNWVQIWSPYKIWHIGSTSRPVLEGALFTGQLIKYLGTSLISLLSLTHLIFLTRSCLCFPQRHVHGFKVCDIQSDTELHQKGGLRPEDLLLLYNYVFRKWEFWQWRRIFQAHGTEFPEGFTH